MKHIRSFLPLISILFLAVAYAEISDSGITRETDDFTGAESCYQIVVNPRDPAYLAATMYHAGEANIFMLTRTGIQAEEIAHNMYTVLSGDTLYLRFGESDVEQLKLGSAKADTVADSLTWQSQVGVTATPTLLRKIADAPGDVRFRISSSQNYDGTITHEQVAAFSSFITECLR